MREGEVRENPKALVLLCKSGSGIVFPEMGKAVGRVVRGE